MSFFQPALSAYQRRLHHDIHGPEEPLPEPLSARQRGSTVEPLRRSSTSPLPELPSELAKKQKTLTTMREVSPSSKQYHPAPSGRTSPRRKTRVSSTPRTKSSALLRSDPELVLTRYSPPLESLTDPLEIIERLRREPGLGFLYLTPVDHQKSVRYNPYNLR